MKHSAIDGSVALALTDREALSMQREPGAEARYSILFVLPDEVEFDQTESVGFVFTIGQVGIESLH